MKNHRYYREQLFFLSLVLSLFFFVGCNKEEAIEVLKECLKMAKAQKDFQKNI